MRIIGLAVLLLAGLGVGWVLGKAMLGPPRISQPQPALSTAQAIEERSIVETAAISNLEAKADQGQEPQQESQVRSAQGDRSDRVRSSGSVRRTVASSKARGGPGVGVVTRPIKFVFRPLKRVNPLKLRLW